MKVTVLNNQTLADIAIQEKGNITAWFDLAMTNNLGLTDTIQTGQALEIQGEPLDNEIVSFYKNKKIKPATWTQILVENNDCDLCKYFK